MDNQVSPALLTELRSENVTLFVGSGLSVNAGLPTWAGLLDTLRELMDGDPTTTDFFNRLDAPQKAQYLYDRVGKAVVVERIVDLFQRSTAVASVLHKTITALPIRTIVTTNWDNLLEKHFQEERITCDVIWRDQQIGASTHRRKILKVHGTIDDKESLVFSEDDYYHLANSHSIFKQYLGTLLATSTVLFVGYSYNDFDFKLIFQNIRQQLRMMARKSYIFTPNASESEMQYFERRGLIPVYYAAATLQEATATFFSHLVQRVSIMAKTTDDRLRLLRRENAAMLPKARGLVIRNQSNLGPLATPAALTDPSLFGGSETTSLEIECAANWRALIEAGASAKCIVCLNNYLAQGKYKPSEAILRLHHLKANLQKYSAAVEIVDIGTPLDNNIEIYGYEVFLKSEKLDIDTKSYHQLRVVRDVDEVRLAAETFDSRFLAVRARNLAKASASFGVALGSADLSAERELLQRYIARSIDEYIASYGGAA